MRRTSGRADERTGGREHRRTTEARAVRYVQFARSFVRRCSCVLRQLIGAPDYERYLEHHARCHAGTEPLGRRAFYADFVSWRFGPGPTRCC